MRGKNRGADASSDPGWHGLFPVSKPLCRNVAVRKQLQEADISGTCPNAEMVGNSFQGCKSLASDGDGGMAFTRRTRRA